MKTSVNNNNIESKNGMSQVVIDLRPQVKHHEGYGREKVANVYFRTQVRAYSRQVYGDYSQEAHEAAEKALTAFYSEVVELLKGEGWTLLNESYAHWHTCPELTNGDQYLYVHPDSISGEVNPADIDALEAKFKALTACEYRGTDNYGDIILTRSEADERTLYRQTYTEGIAATIKECTTTKRSNLYKDRGDALGCIRNRIAIQNKRTDLTGHGTGYYRERKAVAGFVQEEYDRLLQAGYIKEATGQNGRTLCRWINKKEEKELTKARREAEKAEKVRETYKTGLLVTDKQWGHDYERITGIRKGINTYIVTTATEIQLECMKHYRVMEKAKNEHTIKDLPEWVRPGAVLNIDEYWKWDVVEIVELADGCVWYKKGNSVHGWTYDHFISLYVNHRKANVKEYAPEPTLETIGKIRAAYEADGDTYPGDVEGTREYYRDALLQAADGATVCYQFGNCRFDCKKNDKGTWDVHAYDTDGEDTTFEDRTASFFGGMFNDLFGTWGSGNLPEPDGGNKTNYVLEYQKLGHQEARPQEWIEKATSEEREAYYRACVELERMAGDGLPLVIRADSADLSVNPWNALEKRVKTARVFHLGDRVKVKDGNREVTGIVNGIRCNEGSLALGGWCTHYNIQWDKQYQYTTGYGTVTGCGNIGPERIELVERAEFCPEPAAEWLQPGEKVAHYLDYGDGTGDWLIGNVTGYDLDDNGKGVTVIYGEYRTPLKGMVKYQPEMDGKAA